MPEDMRACQSGLRAYKRGFRACQKDLRAYQYSLLRGKGVWTDRQIDIQMDGQNFSQFYRDRCPKSRDNTG